MGRIRHPILDARYEQMRHGGVVRDGEEDRETIRWIVSPTNVLSAIGIGPDERRRVPGVSVALSEAEVHWRGFLESLVARGLRGVEFVVSDDHAGLRAARRAVLGGATWQRCQFHLARNAIRHAPNAEIRKRIGAELRTVWNASTLAKAETALAELVASYHTSAPRLAAWLEQNAPEGLAVFTLPEHHRRRLRTSTPMERAVQQELERRTVKVSLRRAVLPLEGPLILLSPQRRSPRATRQRRTGRDRRKMGLRHEGLHQVGSPGCVTRSQQNFQTTGCSIPRLPNPRIGGQPLEVIEFRDWEDSVMMHVSKYPHDGFRRIDFDLSKPIEPQLAFAKVVLKEEQALEHGKAIQKRRHPKKWLTYLRILDGRVAGASWADLTAILPTRNGTEQAARDAWQQADALRFKF